MSAQPKLVHITTVSESLSLFIGHAPYMRGKGFEVHAVSTPGRMLEQYIRSEAVPFHPIHMQRRISPLADIPAVLKLCALFRRLQPDIVQVQTPKASLLGITAAWMTRTPVRIYNVVGLRMMTASGRDAAILRMAERVTCDLATHIWCVSHSVRDFMVEEKLCPASKIKVLGRGSVNGIDSQGRFNPANVPTEATERFRTRYGIPQDATVVGFVGRIVRDKGVVELATAWKQVRNACERAHLIVAGVRETGDPVPDEVWRDLESDPRVHITGFVHDDDLPAFFAAIDVLVLPTYREGFPVVTLEAASMQLPIVGTRVPGCLDAVVDDVTGTLVDARDANQLAAAIERYVADPELRRSHGRAGRDRVVREFAQQPLWESMYQEYCRLMSSGRKIVSPATRF
jgi:glycosyltransferase involved in cell wall biosynthesis